MLLNTITLWGLSFDRKWLLRAASWRDQPRHGTPERARAVANGVRLGRKPTLTHHQQQEAIKRLKAASAGSIYDEATNRRSGTFLPEAIRLPIQIVALHFRLARRLQRLSAALRRKQSGQIGQLPGLHRDQLIAGLGRLQDANGRLTG